MTPAEKAYQDWVDEGDNRYGSVHRGAYEHGFMKGNQAAVELKATKFIDAHTKPWVGLTDEERKEILSREKDFWMHGWEWKAAEAIEAKLKEKNHG